jgi:glycosyltransferase involved in cell wall biosynthesis
LRIALDATYSLGGALSGVGVYSREILNGLAASEFAENWDWFYRSQRFFRARREPKPANVHRRFLSDNWGDRSADLFHGLNQRLPRRRFRRQVATFHDLFVLSAEYSSPDFRRRFEKQARDAAAGSDLIIAVSRFTATQVEAYLKVPPSRIRVVHHGVVSRSIPQFRREKILLCVGAIQRRKNQTMLIRAFRSLPEGWILVLAGSQGFEADEALREIANSPCVDRIRITGYLSEPQLAEWYARASIFAFPSLDEGFGMPVLEAMAAGVPVIASNRSALPEVCGNAALLVNPEDEDEIASALQLLAKDESCRNQLIQRGFARCAEFNWKRSVEETLRVYREMT